MFNPYDEKYATLEHYWEIAKRLNAERKSAKLSLDELAEKINRSKPTVQKWEKGWDGGTQKGKNLLPTIGDLISLSKLYECTPEYLLCEYDMKTQQVTDICSETGLMQDTVIKLQKSFKGIKESLSPSPYAETIFAFINFFISNNDQINELLFKREQLEFLKKEYIKDTYHDQIHNGYLFLRNSTEGVDLLNSSPNIKLLSFSLKKYYNSMGISEGEADEIIDRLYHYREILSYETLKQSDYALSDCFKCLVIDFFQDYLASDSETYIYRSFVQGIQDRMEFKEFTPIPIIK